MEPLDSSYKIVVAGLKPLVADMVDTAVDGQADMDVVARLGSLRELADVAQLAKADAVIVGLRRRGLPDACHQVLLANPHARVLGVAQGDGRAYLYLLRPDEVELGEVTPEEMVEAIRAQEPRPTFT